MKILDYKYYSLSEVSRILQISRNSIQIYIRNGKLKISPSATGKTNKILGVDLKMFLNENSQNYCSPIQIVGLKKIKRESSVNIAEQIFNNIKWKY
jgi:plasmid maintenance system antidote protein VapI